MGKYYKEEQRKIIGHHLVQVLGDTAPVHGGGNPKGLYAPYTSKKDTPNKDANPRELRMHKGGV